MRENAGALSHAPLFAAEDRSARLRRQYRVLSASNRTLIYSCSEHELLTDTCRALVNIGGYRFAWIGCFGAHAGAVPAPTAYASWGNGALDPSQLQAMQPLGDQTPSLRAMRERAPQIVHEIDDERWGAAWCAQARQRGCMAALAMPLLTDDQCLGVLEVHTDGSEGFELSEVALLNELAADLAFGIVTLRTRRECERQQTDIALLTRVLKMQSAINSAVLRIREPKSLLEQACRVAVEVGCYNSAVVWVVEAGARFARPGYRTGRPVPNVAPQLLRIGDGTECDTSLTARAMRTGEVSICRDLTCGDPPLIGREQLFAAGIRSVVALPFMVDGAPIGALTLTSRDSAEVREVELLLLQDIAASMSFALRYQQQVDAADYLMHYDPLTGLAKRSLFCRRLDKMLGASVDPDQTPTVATLNIQHLNDFNHKFGRRFGDLLLQQVAERLRHLVGDDDCVGDLGAGTFAVVQPAIVAEDPGLASLLEKTVLAQAFLIEGHSVRVSCHSGLARYPMDGTDGNTLVQQAEAALKHAKETGEPWLHFNLDMRRAVAERLALEHKLREAIDEQQFELHYQPQVNVVTGHIESLEALLRWNDPEHGLVMPAGFLPVLESSGLIVPVGQWIVKRVIQDCKRWRRLGRRPVRTAVNVSAVQFRGRAFTDFVLDLAKDWPRDPHGFGLDLEITETALLQDMDGTGRQLHDLRSAGIRIALDDFGTGYSSLGLLSKLPVDLLKIDRSFIGGLPGDHACMTLTRTIINLASAFGLLTVAEGVETSEQFEVLRMLNCDQSQGFFHHQPVPAQEIDELLAQVNSGGAVSQRPHGGTANG
jgi:diguanylate cyclase (GGDEF)-like protein